MTVFWHLALALIFNANAADMVLVPSAIALQIQPGATGPSAPALLATRTTYDSSSERNIEFLATVRAEINLDRGLK